MKITSVLFASAASLIAFSTANAADAIVAAEPEAVEYVRVCDAFGTGFFYIPGTETCLKVGGYARFQVDVNRGTPANNRTSDWDAMSRGQLQFDARTETELGALRSFIDLRGDADTSTSATVNIYQAFIELGGLRLGIFDNWWDAGLNGETDDIASFTRGNAIRYTYEGSGFAAGLAVEELEGISISGTTNVDNNVGLSGMLGFTAGAVSATLLGGYDFDREDGAIRGIVTAAVGPGTLGLGAVWSSGPNAYFSEGDWAISGSYSVKVTDKLTLTPGVQYSDNIAMVSVGPETDQWRYGLTIDYAITSGLAAKISVQHQNRNNGGDDSTSGFFRLDRSF